MYQKNFSRSPYPRNRADAARRQNARSQGRGPSRQSINSANYISRPIGETVKDEYIAKNRFADFLIVEELKQNILGRGYEVPTPIQDQTIPEILNGRDVVGIANTGSGKTAAFLIPIINKIIKNSFEKALIMVPTRELAAQISDELKSFSQNIRITKVLCIGGASMNQQVYALRSNPNVIIGTPGRLKDLINRRLINMSQIKTVVLDEVDRMVDIGFIRDMEYILGLLPRERQSLFFSATVSPQIAGIIKSFSNDPLTISVKTHETAANVEQDIIKVRDAGDKMEKLHAMLRQEEFKKVLIFGRTKWGVEKLSNSLTQNGFLATSIHGNKSQGQRQRALMEFKQNRLKILVATDVAARGLDIDDVSHVINFDEPATYTDYVHRIGRTGRGNKLGKALTFVM